MIDPKLKCALVSLKATIDICNGIFEDFLSQIEIPFLDDIGAWKEIINDLGSISAIKLMKIKTDMSLLECKEKIDEIMKK